MSQLTLLLYQLLYLWCILGIQMHTETLLDDLVF
jgi:hypothetical protein